MPLIWGEDPDQGLPDGQPRAAERAASAQPRDAIYRFRALKVSSGRKHHGIVTKAQTNDGCEGRRGYGGAVSAGTSRWQRDELGAERKAARRKCSKALAPILDIIRKYAVHAWLKAGDASRECPA
jgi:hypothetical protein